MSFRIRRVFWGLLFAGLFLRAAGLERPKLQMERAWTVGEIVPITPSGSLPVTLSWREPPKIPNSSGEFETGGILTQVFIDRRGRLRVLTMQGGTESEKDVLRRALRAAKLNLKFPEEVSTGTKAWFATYFSAVPGDRNNTCAVIKQLTPVWLERVLVGGSIRERRVRVLVHPSGGATMVSENKVDADVAAAVGEAFKEWKFAPPLINGVAGYAEIDVPLLFTLSPDRTAFFTPATILQQTSPRRTPWMRLRHIGDYYRLRITIGKDGKVAEAALLDPTSSPEFNEAIIRETKTWRCSPEVRNGVAVEATAVIAFGRPPNPVAAAAKVPAVGKHGDVIPPHARRSATLPVPVQRTGLQLKIAVDKTGAVSDTLIERAASRDEAAALVRYYLDSDWEPATANGAPAEYVFRVRR